MQLKKITPEGIPAALARAERYRLLHDAWAAESICLDVLEVDPHNEPALVMLLLAITDQFRDDLTDAGQRARAVLPRLQDPYDRAYYSGIILERRALAQLEAGRHGAADAAAESLREAMRAYERAERQRPAGNDDAILRWNTCARLLERYAPVPETVEYAPTFGE